MHNSNQLEHILAQTYQRQLDSQIKLQQTERAFEMSSDELDKHDNYKFAFQAYRQNRRQHQVVKLLFTRCMKDNN